MDNVQKLNNCIVTKVQIHPNSFFIAACISVAEQYLFIQPLPRNGPRNRVAMLHLHPPLMPGYHAIH
jgi:hypothetical protein